MQTGSIEIIIGVGIWVLIFLVWFVRNYPEKTRSLFGRSGSQTARVRKPQTKKKEKKKAKKKEKKAFHKKAADYKDLVQKVESICAKDTLEASDAATLVESVILLNEIEPASGQIWEAYALDTLERAKIVCDDCGLDVEKTIRKTGIRIQCSKCKKWLALRNSKVTVIDPNRPDLEEWETQTRH
jgi:hypothetical protein